MIPTARIKARGQRPPASPRTPVEVRPWPVVAPTDRVVFGGEKAIVLAVHGSGRLVDLLAGRELKTFRRVPFVEGGAGGWCLPPEPGDGLILGSSGADQQERAD
jgi:hypothetical protein